MNKAIFIIAIVTGMFLSSCKKQQVAPPSAIPVNLYTVKSEKVVYYDRYISTTVALNQANLVPQVQGYITGIFFKEGTNVKKGEKLYEIDRSIYENNYNIAAANLKVAEGNLKQAQQDAERYENLNQHKAVAKQIYDHAITTLEISKSQYNSTVEALKTAETNLSFSIIKAPFDGIIGFSQVKLGDLAIVGQTLLNTISSDNPMGVDFVINEKQLPYFEKIWNDKTPHIDSLFTLILSDNSLYPYVGKIFAIDRSVDPQTGTITIKLVFPNPKHFLRAGMTFIVRVHNADITPQMVIPNEAVVEEMGEYFVYVAKDTAMSNSNKANGETQAATKGHTMIAYQTKVQLGSIIPPNVIIKTGLKEGQRIVVQGVQSLHNGSVIKP